MYSLNINNINSISNLENYMLNSVKNDNVELKNVSEKNISEKNISENNIFKKEKIIIPRNNIYVNYNKLKSKYNENSYKKNNFEDKLFWCFYKLYNNISDKELEYINIFSTEKNFKLASIEKLKLNKELLKKHKIQKNFVETELTNDKYISLYSLKTLCILYNINLIIIKDNNTYTRFSNNTLDNTIDNLDNFNFIKLNYKNSSSINNNFELVNNIDRNEIINALKNYYYVKNLDKPLKSLSSYKLNEIIEISEKLSINLYNDSAKKKTKLELYSDCMKKLS
tara:strand:+ start:5957 stop:6802 length:846 start_codon:yes stop_codon:yes gene_type:complete